MKQDKTAAEIVRGLIAFAMLKLEIVLGFKLVELETIAEFTVFRMRMRSICMT
jgi:hypothetical protein